MDTRPPAADIPSLTPGWKIRQENSNYFNFFVCYLRCIGVYCTVYNVHCTLYKVTRC